MIMLDLIRKLKFARLKPEERYLIGYLQKTKEYNNGDSILYQHNKELIFKYEIERKRLIIILNSQIFHILQFRFRLNYDNIIILFKEVFEKYYNIKPEFFEYNYI